MPALGSPAIAASTTSFQTEIELELVTGEAGLRKRGVCRVGVANRALPRPPGPPRAMTWRLWATVRSPMRRSFASMSCADGHADLGVLPVGTVLLAATAVPASAGLDVLDPPEGGEVTQARIDDDHDVSPATAVTAVRAAFRNVLLAAKAQPAVATAASLRHGCALDRGTPSRTSTAALVEGEARRYLRRRR